MVFMALNISTTKTAAQPLSWLKKGSDASAAMQQAEYAAAAAKAASDRMPRFWLQAGEERTVTFLDGALDGSGGLECMVIHEHTIQVGQKWDNFICVAESENCPICAAGSRADTVALLTVVDHTPYTFTKGPNVGKVVKDVRKLYVAKQSTFRELKHYALKRGGLRGWTVEIGRMSDTDARVGKSFQFITQQTPETLTGWGELGHPADYGKELRYMTAEELLKNGIGKAISGPGYNKPAISDTAVSDLM
jgi:hypothetical protein